MNLFNFFKKKKENGKYDVVNAWINEGKKLIYPEKYEAWENFVYRACDGKYFGLEVEGVLTILRELETDKTIEEVVACISKDTIAKDYMRNDLKNRVFEFSKRGAEFLEYILGDDINDLLLDKIAKIKSENEKLRKKYEKK